MHKHPNTFDKGLNTDISDLVIPSNTMRNCKNMRMLDLDGTSYAVTTIRGTEQKFNLSTGYFPIASVQYGDVLYIMSGNDKVGVPGAIGNVEIGSYPSPNYPTGGTETNVYAPFMNLDDGAFNVEFFNLLVGQAVDLSIQPEYDGSVNVIITSENNPPRIVNSGFNKDFEITERREGANTNDYTSGSVDEETRLVLRSQQIMNVAYGAIENGGKLQPGNYVYIFKYATADFNETDVVNQSGICSVFEGYETNKYNASVNVETTKRVRLTLSNVDTDFAYLKIYFKYNRGDDSNLGNVYELTQPILITGDEFEFIHDGFESTVEVSEDAINVDFSAFDSAVTHTQANGYLILGNVKEADIAYQELASAAQTITAATVSTILPRDNPYSNPENIYNSLGAFRAETYPYGIVFVMNDGSTSPVFPIQGYDNVNWAALTTDQQNKIKEKGLYRFQDIETANITYLSTGTLSLGVKFNISLIPQSIKDETIGFFFVRGERKPDMISQGIVIPTMRVPAYDYTRDDYIKTVKNYYENFTEETDYKSFPVIDGMVEPWRMLHEAAGAGELYVADAANLNKIKDGYFPSPINTGYTIPSFNPEFAGDTKLKSLYRWAYYSADYILNEARYITALQRSNLGFRQWKRVEMESVSDGQLNDKYNTAPYDVSTSLLYKFTKFNSLGTPLVPTFSNPIDNIEYVPSSTFATGGEFISAMSNRLKENPADPPKYELLVRSFVDGFFGIKLTDAAGFSGAGLADDPWFQPRNPLLNGGSSWGTQTEGPRYENVGRASNQGYLISIYPRSSGFPITDINDLYDTIDGIAYRQVSDRIAWADAGTELDVFGGDCYIGEVYKKLNRSGYTDPLAPADEVNVYDDSHADNINQGVVFSFMHESEYNPALRLPYLANTADSEERTFHPYRNSGNFNKYRSFRLEETNKTNQGHSETERPKTFVPIPSNAPFIAQNFFTRLIHSEKHVPNAFQNGYRSFIGINHEDYDPDMGEIVSLLTHRDQVFVVFEHGIGIGPVNQRIQTGSDSAGAIFVEPSGVLPPNLGFASREIGAQDGNAVIQTPSSIYGIDQQRKKIWQFREGLLMISDMGMQQLMERATLTTPRLGYDPHYHEVIFTTDDWTLCYKEGLEAFTSFYSFQGYQYARRSKEFYSFNKGLGGYQLHNIDGVRTIYGNIEQSYVEVVVNPSANATKVYDFLNIVSNEIAPKQIDLYTYNVETYKEDVLDESKMFQHAVIEQGTDFFTQEDRIRLRDRRFVAQIPHVSYINDIEWGKGRFRNKYVIVRLTYETDQKVEVLSLITDFRISAS